MRTWVDTDKICEDTLNIIKLLSTSDVIKFSDVSEKIILLEECLDEEEYECGWFSDAAFKLLKDLLRIRIKLRKTDPTHHLVPVLIQAVDGLKEQLRLNRKHANELRPGVSEEGRNDEITAAERQKPGQKGLSLSAAIVPERGAGVAKTIWSYLHSVYGRYGHGRVSDAGRAVDVSADGDSASQNGGAGDSFCGGAVMVTGIQLCTAGRFVSAQDRECIKAEEGPVWHKY